MTYFVTVLSVGFCILFTSSPCWALEKNIHYRMTDEDRHASWSIGLVGRQHNLKSRLATNLIGISNSVQIGYAHIDKSLMYVTNIEIIDGPYLPSNQQSRSIDFKGFGASIGVALSAESKDLRSKGGNYGLALGVSHMDIAGRILGSSNFSPEQTKGKQDINVSCLSLTPSVFFTWLRPSARKVSNKPEDLSTRIEGYYLNIGIQFPILASYTLRNRTFQRLDPNDDLDSNPVAPDEVIEDQWLTTREKRSLYGFSIIVSFSALLGV